MKYRRLSIEELKDMDTAFIRFLAANGIPGDEWTKIKETDAKRTNELLDVFSDTVIHETLSKIEYLQIIQAKEIKTFHCLPEQIKLIGLIVDGDSNIDFSQMESPQMMAQQIAASWCIKITATTQNHSAIELMASLISLGATLI